MSATVIPPAATLPSSPKAKTRGQRLCAQSGYLLLVLFAAGMILCRFIPPPGANQSTAQLVGDYTKHTTELRIGLTLMILASGFYATWSGALSVQLKRLEGQFSPFAYTELACGAVNMLVIMLPLYILLAAAFRPLRDPQVTRALNDVAMIPFIGAFAPTVMSCLVIAGAILNSDRTDIFPRWLAWVNLACIPLLLPAMAIPFFKSGALAWQGALEFWLAAVVFFGWFLLMTVMTLRAITRQETTPEPVAVA
jgi:hypothetical protein